MNYFLNPHNNDENPEEFRFNMITLAGISAPS
jgi:hypothetical protein